MVEQINTERKLIKNLSQPNCLNFKIMCKFKDYKNEERKCIDCDYVIPKTINDESALNQTIQSTDEIPGCVVSLNL